MNQPSLPNDRTRAWLDRGDFYDWRPPGSPASSQPVRIFHLEAGAADAPLLVLVHGWPTSSIDWCDVIGPLAERFRVAALDFPGYGFSGKPSDWSYGLELDAQLLESHITEFLGADRCVMVSHDRGDSVALLLRHRLAQAGHDGRLRLEHHVLLNGNVYLPLAVLTGFQKLLLDPASAPRVLEVVTPDGLAEGLGSTTFSPPRSPEDATVRALAATFAWEDGIAVIGQTIQYLRERAEHELVWLRSLEASDIPTTVVWGMHDTVAPPRVAMHVWEHFLRHKPGENELWLLPGANHYLQNDRPKELVEILLRCLDPHESDPPAPLGDDVGAPTLIDRSGSGQESAEASLRF